MRPDRSVEQNVVLQEVPYLTESRRVLGYLIPRVNGRKRSVRPERVARVVLNIVLSALYFCLKFRVCLQRLQLFAGILNGVECARNWSFGRVRRYGETCLRNSVPFAGHKSHAVPERARKAKASNLCQGSGAATPQCPDNAGFPERSGLP